MDYLTTGREVLEVHHSYFYSLQIYFSGNLCETKYVLFPKFLAHQL